MGILIQVEYLESYVATTGIGIIYNALVCKIILDFLDEHGICKHLCVPHEVIPQEEGKYC